MREKENTATATKSPPLTATARQAMPWTLTARERRARIRQTWLSELRRPVRR